MYWTHCGTFQPRRTRLIMLTQRIIRRLAVSKELRTVLGALLRQSKQLEKRLTELERREEQRVQRERESQRIRLENSYRGSGHHL